MISHYLRSAWRTIRRNPLYSFISIGCLAIGIAVSLSRRPQSLMAASANPVDDLRNE